MPANGDLRGQPARGVLALSYFPSGSRYTQ